MNIRKVKIFDASSIKDLEDKINTWLEDTDNRVESIAYNASGDKYSALVYYRYEPIIVDGDHKTEPLAE